MMVTDFICSVQNHYAGDFFRYVGDFLNNRIICRNNLYKIGHQHPESVANISNLSPTHLVANIRHQHRCNIDNPADLLLVYCAFSELENEDCIDTLRQVCGKITFLAE